MSTPTIREFLSNWSDTANITLATAGTTPSTSTLVAVHAGDYYTAADLNAPTGTGWSLVVGEGNASSGHAHIKVWTKPATAGGESIEFDQPIDAGHHAHLFVLDGVTAIDVSAGDYDNTVQTGQTLPAVTTTAADDLIIAAAISLSSSGAGAVDYTAPGGLTKAGETDRGVYSTAASFSGASTTTGANGPWTATASAAREYAAVTVAVKGPATPTTNAPAGNAGTTVTAGTATVGLTANNDAAPVGVAAPFSMSGSGTGVEMVADQAIPVGVTAVNPTVTTAPGAGTTASAGTAAVTADAGTAVPAATAPAGFASVVADSANAHTTTGGGGHQVGLPSDLQSVTVVGTYVDSNGTPLTGTIEFLPSVDLVSAGQHTAVRRIAIVGRLDAQGDLKASDGVSPLLIPATDDPDITPSGWTYTVTEKLTYGSKPPFNLSAPQLGGDIDLPAASPSVPPVVPGGVAVTKINAVTPNGAGLVTLTAADVGAAPTAHSHPIAGVTGLSDALAGLEPAGTAATAVAAHVAAGDPHPQYLTAAEGGAAYAAASHTHTASQISAIPLTREFSVSGDLAVQAGMFSWFNDFGRAITVTAVRATVGTAPSGAPVTVELKKNGNGFTTPVTTSITSGNTTAKATATGATLADGDRITVDITSVGGAAHGADLVVQVTMELG